MPNIDFRPVEEAVKKYAAERKALEVYHNLFEYSLEPQTIVDDKGFFIDVNAEFVRRIEYSKEMILSRPFWTWIHPDDIAPTEKAYASAVKGVQVLTFSNRYLCGNGKYKRFNWYTSTHLPFVIYGKVIIEDIE